MNWFLKLITSSIGQKVVMSLTGLFLISFLLVHLSGNLQLLFDDGGEAFNAYAKFMTSNPLIKFISYGLYAFILLHAVQGIALYRHNRQARGKAKYAVNTTRVTSSTATFPAVNMAWLGIIILAFIILHMYQFWLQMKLGATEYVMIEGEKVKDLYSLVEIAFQDPIYVGIYVVSMIVIGFHLWHGFQSSFQTLGLNHKKYSPAINFVGRLYSIVVPAGFALIPIYMFLIK